MESPFFLLYGRDPRLPTLAILSPPTSRSNLNVTEYGVELATKMSSAWELARKSVRKAQKKQKKYFDRKAKPSPFQNGTEFFFSSLERDQGQQGNSVDLTTGRFVL